MTDRATCPGCGKDLQVTLAGTFRLHRREGATCPGAGQRAAGVTPRASHRGPTGLTGPPPPDEPAAGRSCDGGHCDRPSIGWRLFRDQPEWLPVCGIHMDGPTGRTRIHDPA
ncbi:hypothetical protein QA860_08160 [Streptomyces stelliscabiei]|uniref:hypothetical protein n=1 Tax=Streptomyces stelliscabiei TaxID=146820 RepID=UPI002FF0199F